MTITAIETSYAGCRFRSRLEARWAVFFNHLGVPWAYEPQGYLIDGRPYLPDFWLPSLGAWAEVKGRFAPGQYELLTKAVMPGGGLPAAPDTRAEAPAAIVLLGDVPDPGPRTAWHPLLRPGLIGHSFAIVPCVHMAEFRYIGLANKKHGIFPLDSSIFPSHALNLGTEPDAILAGGSSGLTVPDPRVLAAYHAARAARFEYGENGGRP